VIRKLLGQPLSGEVIGRVLGRERVEVVPGVVGLEGAAEDRVEGPASGGGGGGGGWRCKGAGGSSAVGVGSGCACVCRVTGGYQALFAPAGPCLLAPC
jgi:hypothetical protein